MSRPMQWALLTVAMVVLTVCYLVRWMMAQEDECLEYYRDGMLVGRLDRDMKNDNDGMDTNGAHSPETE